MMKQRWQVWFLAVLLLCVAARPGRAINVNANQDTLVISNEGPGYLITKLINAGHGADSVYQATLYLSGLPGAGAILTPAFLNALASCPAASEIFSTTLAQVITQGLSVSISTDGSARFDDVLGYPYAGRYPVIQTGNAGIQNVRIVYSSSSQAPLNANVVQGPLEGMTTTYNAFAVMYAAGQAGPQLSTASAASLTAGGALAPEAIAVSTGQGLASTAASAPASGTLPTTLAGATLKVKDSAGVERMSPLWFVSAGSIYHQIPAGTSTGQATLTVTNQSQTVMSGTLQVDSVAPGLFSANSDGHGAASGRAVRVKGDVTQSWQYVFSAASVPGTWVTAPIDMGPATDQIILELYGTGIRGRSSLGAVSATIGGVSATVDYAGGVDGYAGLDQVNLRVPRSLAGHGEVDIVLRVDGKTANTVAVNFK